MFFFFGILKNTLDSFREDSYNFLRATVVVQSEDEPAGDYWCSGRLLRLYINTSCFASISHLDHVSVRILVFGCTCSTNKQPPLLISYTKM